MQSVVKRRTALEPKLRDSKRSNSGRNVMNIQQDFLLDCLRFYTKDSVDKDAVSKAEEWLLQSGESLDVRELSALKLTRADLTSISEAIGKLQAHTDPLTGTLRRDVLKVINEVTIKKWLENKDITGIELGYLDLDKFGQINKLYNQNTGDEVLQKFSRLMDGATSQKGILVRMGGDEFIFIRPTEQDDEFLTELRANLMDREIETSASNKPLVVSASIGRVYKTKMELQALNIEKIFDALAIEAGEDLLVYKQANKKKLRIRKKR